MFTLKHLSIAVFSIVLLAVVQAGACQLTPEGARGVQESAQLPGMEEALVVKDRAIQTAITMSIKADVELLQCKVEVKVVNAKVVLSGKVWSDELKARAERYAKETEGVQEVLNKIEVDPKLKDKSFSLDD
jgi:osmotically-inducible protein OsmY